MSGSPQATARAPLAPLAPLHRLALHRDDPAQAWLGPADGWSIAAAGLFAWAGYGLLYVVAAIAVFAPPSAAARVIGVGGWVACIVGGSFVAGLIASIQHQRMLALARGGAVRAAKPVDDWTALATEPDGQIVSLVGRVRARTRFSSTIDGKPAVGVAVLCRVAVREYHVSSDRDSPLFGHDQFSDRGITSFTRRHPCLMESMHDFDIVDDEGRTIGVQAAGARLVGDSNVIVQADDIQGHNLIGSLEIPVAVEPLPWEVLALRDGDPVLVIGFKTSVVDPLAPRIREAPLVAAVASAPDRPLLVYPISPISPISPIASSGGPPTR